MVSATNKLQGKKRARMRERLVVAWGRTNRLKRLRGIAIVDFYGS